MASMFDKFQPGASGFLTGLGAYLMSRGEGGAPLGTPRGDPRYLQMAMQAGPNAQRMMMARAQEARAKAAEERAAEQYGYNRTTLRPMKEHAARLELQRKQNWANLFGGRAGQPIAQSATAPAPQVAQAPPAIDPMPSLPHTITDADIASSGMIVQGLQTNTIPQASRPAAPAPQQPPAQISPVAPASQQPPAQISPVAAMQAYLAKMPPAQRAVLSAMPADDAQKKLLEMMTRKPELALGRLPGEQPAYHAKKDFGRLNITPVSSEALGGFQGSGPNLYAGRSMDAQKRNVMNEYAKLRRENKPIPPALEQEYGRLWNEANKGWTQTLADGTTIEHKGWEPEKAGWPKPMEYDKRIAAAGKGVQDLGPGNPGNLGEFSTGVTRTGSAADRKNKAILKKKSLVLRNMRNGLNRYRTQLTKYGLEVMPGGAKAVLSGAHMNLLMQGKEFYNLGVLNGPDMAVMSAMMNDPTSPIALQYGAEGLQRQLDQFEKNLDDNQMTTIITYGTPSQAIQFARTPQHLEMMRSYIDKLSPGDMKMFNNKLDKMLKDKMLKAKTK